MKKTLVAALALILCLSMLFTAGCSRGEEMKKTTEPAPSLEPAAPETQVPEPVEPPFKTVSFVAAGDNLIHDSIYNCAAQYASRDPEETRKHNFKPMYEAIREQIASADIAMINQETMMAGPDFALSGYPTFNSPQTLAEDLKEIGFDVLSIANNHMLDKGAKGLYNTIEHIESLGLTEIGGYRNQADLENIRVVERDGVRIALIAFTYGTNGIKLPGSSEMVVPYISDSLILSQLERAKTVSDFIVVSIHWGVENSFNVSKEQERVASLLAENGAGIIVGTHPHVIQKIDWIDNGKGGKVLCAYSLGNLISNMEPDKCHLGGLLSFDITNEGGDSYYAKNILFTPTVFFFNRSYREDKLYYLWDFTPEIAAQHRRYADSGLRTEKMYKYYTDLISAEFWPEQMKNSAAIPAA